MSVRRMIEYGEDCGARGVDDGEVLSDICIRSQGFRHCNAVTRSNELMIGFCDRGKVSVYFLRSYSFSAKVLRVVQSVGGSGKSGVCPTLTFRFCLAGKKSQTSHKRVAMTELYSTP